MTEAARRFDELEAEIARRAERKRLGEDVTIRDLLPELLRLQPPLDLPLGDRRGGL